MTINKKNSTLPLKPKLLVKVSKHVIWPREYRKSLVLVKSVFFPKPFRFLKVNSTVGDERLNYRLDWIEFFHT